MSSEVATKRRTTKLDQAIAERTGLTPVRVERLRKAGLGPCQDVMGAINHWRAAANASGRGRGGNDLAAMRLAADGYASEGLAAAVRRLSGYDPTEDLSGGD